MDLIEMLEDSLKDLSPSEVKVLKAFTAQQRLEEKDRAGLLKFYSAIYCLLENETYRREQAAKQIERDLLGVSEPVVKWTQEDHQNVDQ